MINLWSANHPARFWLCQPDVPDSQWAVAIQRAFPALGLSPQPDDVDQLLALGLGEGQFGPHHWRLSFPRRVYYRVKPFLPRPLICRLRRIHSGSAPHDFALGWPIEDRYARFLWEVMSGVLLGSGRSSMSYRHFWPDGARFTFVLTHDIETARGQAFARAVADLEESLGFRSSFNFVPERYPLDLALMEELRTAVSRSGFTGSSTMGCCLARMPSLNDERGGSTTTCVPWARWVFALPSFTASRSGCRSWTSNTICPFSTPIRTSPFPAARCASGRL